MIKGRFITQVVNKAGIYLMTFFTNGLETPVIVDDILPTTDGELCFARDKQDRVLWPALLEKAWAKLCGSYAEAESGLSTIALMHVIGTPSIHISIEDYDKADVTETDEVK